MAPLGENAPSGVDLTALRARASTAATALRTTRTALEKELRRARPRFAQLRTALLQAAALGVIGAVPVDAAGTDDKALAALVAQARPIAAELDRRKAAVADDLYCPGRARTHG